MYSLESRLLYIFYGEDDFSLKAALAEIKEGLGDETLVATNTSVFQGQTITLEELIATCDTIPFLAPKRLVIIDGLLGRFEQRDKKRRSQKSEATGWLSLKEYIPRMPDSTDLVLVDGKLSKNNQLLTTLYPQASVRQFPFLKGDRLRSWMQSRARKAGCSISPNASDLLANLIGSNLWLLSNEIDKLCLYAGGRNVEESDVRSLVAYAQETNIFAMVDAILDRKPTTATRLLHRLEDEGAAPPYLLVMITRQFRMVIQAKDLLRYRQQDAEIGRTLGITSDYVLQKTKEQARKHSMERLGEIYRKLLDTDISIKTGRLKGDKGELALDLLIGDLC